MSIKKEKILPWLLLITSLFVTSCAWLSPEKDSEAIIKIKSSKNLNPDSNNRPSPIVLYIYQLASRDAFDNAPFFELYENAKNILGNDLIANPQEVEISPGNRLDLNAITLNENTGNLGFLAAYRNVDDAIWRAGIEITKNKKNYIYVNIGQLSLTAETGEKNKEF